jgi:hypothetical protein
MSRNCSFIYKVPSSAHLIKDLSFKFCNISIGLDELSPFQYAWQDQLFMKSAKKKFQKYVLMFLIQVVISNSQSFPNISLLKLPIILRPPFNSFNTCFHISKSQISHN